MYRKILGNLGEEAAVAFLLKRGYKILERNYRKRIGEIDIIAFDNKFDEYVFVEVKTRKNLNFGYPEESVNQKKKLKIQKTAQWWLLGKKLKDPKWRIDVISILWSEKTPTIDHIQNI